MTRDELGWRFEYAESGLVTKVTDPSGRATRMQYTLDKSGRLRKVVRRTEGGGDVVQAFDDSGRLRAMTDGVAYGYDDFDRLNLVQRQGQPAVTYAWDTQGRMTQLKVGDFYRVDYTYDFLGRLETMSTPAGVIRYEYLTGQGQVVRTLPNGVKTFWKYQVNGELEQIAHVIAEKPDSNRYKALAEYTYDYGPDGRISAIRERSQQGEFVRQYNYDTMGRLTKATGPGGREYRYEYDQVGNRTRATATGKPDQVSTCDWAGRLTTVNGKPTTHDANGNLTELTLDGVTRNYSFTPDGQLAEARVNGQSVQYRYDGFGRLVSRGTSGGESRFIPDPLSPIWQPLVMEEQGEARTLVIWSGVGPVALVRGGEVEWLLHDQVGSVALTVGSEGQVMWRDNGAPFGAQLKQLPGSSGFRPGFAALFGDEDARVYVTVARALAADLGGFLQPDPHVRVPQGSQGDVSPYVYCGSDPVKYVDRDGFEPRTSEEIAFDWEIAHLARSYEDAAFLERRESILWSGPENVLERVFKASLKESLKQIWTPSKVFLEPTELAILLNKLMLGAYRASLTNTLNLARNARISLGEPLWPLIRDNVPPYTRASVYLGTGVELTNISLFLLGKFQGYLDQVQLRARSFQAMDPPRYLDRQTLRGWEGSGRFKTTRGEMHYYERQDANVFSEHPSPECTTIASMRVVSTTATANESRFVVSDL